MKIGTCAEVVRLRPREGAADRLMEIRPEMEAQIRGAFPGFVDCRLHVADDGTWVDVWWWETRDMAEATLREKEKVPAFLEWEQLVEVVTFDWTEVVAHA